MSLRRGEGRTVFARIFEVNNEIGRSVRTRPSLREPLLELQSKINVITMSLKAGDTGRAVHALELVLESFEKMKQGPRAPKKNL